MGDGVQEVLEGLVDIFPAPTGSPDQPLKALIFDSWFDNYQGSHCALYGSWMERFAQNMMIKMMSSGQDFEVLEVGMFLPKRTKVPQLGPGEVGYICAGMKELSDTKIGDTITDAKRPTSEALPGYRDVQPVVFCGLYTTDTSKYEDLRDSLEKLQLNDSSFGYEPETSLALGFGFRCGFLGLLHMEIIRERLEREYGLDLD